MITKFKSMNILKNILDIIKAIYAITDQSHFVKFNFEIILNFPQN